MTSQITPSGSLYDALYVPEEHRHVSISREQSEFLHSFILEKHVAIDPYQHRFADIGLKNVERVDLAIVEFYLPSPTTEPPAPKRSAIDRLRRLLRK